mmetsp:Transcript_19902/g.50288  ORF Transcript_19902/g.50288 Transcript_19902/m.50288 type:complete len:492 (+) Transcript_19902:577-2052(+)
MRLVHLLLGAQVLANVALVEHHERCGLDRSAGRGGLRSEAEAERDAVHVQHHHAGVLRRVLRYPAKTDLGDVVAVQERHLRVGLDPHLVLGVLGQKVEAVDGEVELARLGELAEQRAERDELVAVHIGGRVQLLGAHVVHALVVKAEDMRLVLAVDQAGHVLPNKALQLREDQLGLLVGERPHRAALCPRPRRSPRCRCRPPRSTLLLLLLLLPAPAPLASHSAAPPRSSAQPAAKSAGSSMAGSSAPGAENDQPTPDFVERFLPAGSQVSFGALSGWAAGYALRQGGKVAGVLLGGSFMALQSLSYLGYVEVDWRKLERDYTRILDRDSDGKVTAKDFQLLLNNTTEVLKFNLPAGSGFTAGFSYGLSGSAKLALGATAAYGGLTSVALGGIPTDLFTAQGVQRLAHDGMDSLRHIPSNIMNAAVPAADPMVKLDQALQARSIEELRQLEYEIKHGMGISADLMGIQLDKANKSEVLNQIEAAKKVVKGY